MILLHGSRPASALRIVAAGVLAWLVVSHGVSSFLAQSDRSARNWLVAQQPRVLFDIADKAVKRVDAAKDAANPSPEDIADAHKAAGRALLADPLNPDILTLLGQTAKAEDDANRFMLAALATSPHATRAEYWLVLRALSERNYGDVAKYADLALRSSPTLSSYVASVFAAASENGGEAQIAALLSSKPPWRSQVLADLSRSIKDARTPLQLFSLMDEQGAGPSAKELSSYLNFLVGKGFYDLAYSAWLQFLPAEQLASAKLLFNADFKLPLSGQVFDWTIQPSAGIRIGVEPTPGDRSRQALHLVFSGRVGEGNVAQFLSLEPGSYRFSGQQMGSLVGPRGLRWQISCANAQGNRQIAATEMLFGGPKWADFGMTFNVPSSDCRMQELKLLLDARSLSERIASGSMWMTDLVLARSDTK